MSAPAELVPASDPGALEADPVQYMAVVLNRAKSWLAEAQSIDSVRETKAIAVGYESVIREKELAFDAQLSATEIVRRCERRIGELVREGQTRGEIAKPGDIGGNRAGDGRTQHLRSSAEFFEDPTEGRRDAYAMADAPDEQFERAITDAREEGNLSRANVVRKVKGVETARAPRKTPMPPSFDTARGQQLAAAHARRFTDFAAALAGYAGGIQSLNIALIRGAMDPAELDEWIRSLGDSLTKLRRFRSDLQEGRN